MPRLGIYDWEIGRWHAREGTRERLESSDVDLILDVYLELLAHGVTTIQILTIDDET